MGMHLSDSLKWYWGSQQVSERERVRGVRIAPGWFLVPDDDGGLFFAGRGIIVKAGRVRYHFGHVARRLADGTFWRELGTSPETIETWRAPCGPDITAGRQPEEHAADQGFADRSVQEAGATAPG